LWNKTQKAVYQKSKGTRMIPKKLHQFWLSGDGFKKKYWPWRMSWLNHNPDFDMVLWTIEKLLSLPLPDKLKVVLAHSNIQYTLKTDVGRWLPVYYEGGIIADTDVECLKSIDPLLNTKSFCGKSRPPDDCGNAVVGFEPGNQLCMDAANLCADLILQDIKKANRDIVFCGVRPHGTMLNKCETIYPVDYFYPYSWQEKKAGKKPTPELYKNSYCIHHWSGLDVDGWVWNTIHKNEDKFRVCPHLKKETENV
jgi:hypothetical protein